MTPPQASFKITVDDLSEETTASAISLALLSLDPQRANDILTVASDDNSAAKLIDSIPVWSALPEGQASHPDVDDRYPYAFTREISGSLWRIARTRRKLILIDFRLADYSAKLATEACVVYDGDVRTLSIKTVVVVDDPVELQRIAKLPSTPHRRILSVGYSGRRGFLLPKSKNWNIIPLPQISFGPSAADLAWNGDSLEIPLEKFIGEAPGTGAKIET